MSTTAIPTVNEEVPDPFAQNNAESNEPLLVTPGSEELDDVEQQVEHRTWVFKGLVEGIIGGTQVSQEVERTYTQKPLSYTGMIQFTGLLGRKIDETMAGPEGLSVSAVGDLMDMAQYAGEDNARELIVGRLVQSDFAGVDAFIRGFAKLAAYTPDIIDEAQCIWLRIPFRDRMLIRDLWNKPIDEGGLSMDDGEAMMDLFIRQNYGELERFFVERARRIARTVRAERKKLHPDG